jgi:hypothetical protein
MEAKAILVAFHKEQVCCTICILTFGFLQARLCAIDALLQRYIKPVM